MGRNVLLVMAIVMMLLLILWPKKDQRVRVEASAETAVSIEHRIIDNKLTEPEINKVSESNKKPDKLSPDEQYQLEQLMAEISNPEYSGDPFIEASMQQLKLFGCDMFSQSWLSPEMRQHNSSEWLEKTTQQCEAQKRKRPRLYFQSRSFQVNENIPANTEWGQKLKALRSLNHIERKAVSGEFLKFALREQKAHWLMLAMLYNEGQAFDYTGLLNSNNARYNRITSEAALNLLLCEWDDTELCGSSSMIMVMSCVNTPGDCAMRYPEWFEKNYMPGMKADVALLLAYFKTYANGEDVE